MAEGPANQPDEAMIDLLIKQATEGLSPEEQRALDVLDDAVASAYARDFERAAAALTLAGTAARLEPPPAALKARLEQQAQEFSAGREVADFQGRRAAASEAPRRASRVSAAGWYAAAACALLAVIGWLRSPPAPLVVSTPAIIRPPAVTPPPPPPTPAQQRAALLAQPDSIKVPLAATKDPAAAGVSGDVVWDPATQRGFLHFVGLKPNDPRVDQYQTWIIDAARDKRYPVDAGVFNVPADSSEVIIPIHAVLPVSAPKAFAVTVEKPGGVVVSSLRHVVAMGTAG
jgi:hypothetical protein